MKRLLCIAGLFASLLTTWSVFAAEPAFPEGFPPEWKTKKLLKSESRKLVPGVMYYHYHFADLNDGQPLSFYLVVVPDWNKAKIRAKLAVSDGKLQTVRQLVAAEKKQLVASVNGAYFNFVPAVTYFMLKAAGKVYQPKLDNKDIWAEGIVFDDAEYPQFVRGNAENLEKYKNMIQGYRLGRDGINQMKSSKKPDHTPYTAVGLNPKKRMFLLWVNDGRHAKDSPGIGFSEIADYLIRLGCTDVVSIDGGGSTTLVLPNAKTGKHEVVNHPSDNRKFDHAGERAIHNCLYLVKDAGK